MNNFAEKLAARHQGVPQDDLSPLREKGWDHFSSLGLPTQKQEAFRYVKLRHLYTAKQAPARRESLPTPKGFALVFVDGKLSKAHSTIPSELTVLSLQEALPTFGLFLKRRLKEQFKTEKDPFAALNLALVNEGTFIYLPPGVQIKEPLKIVHVSDRASLLTNRLHFFLGKKSALTCLMKSEVAENAWSNVVYDMAIEEGSSLTWQQETQGGWQSEAFRATLKKEASLNSVAFLQPGECARQDIHIELCGEGSSASLEGIWDLKKNQEAHVHVLMHHSAPNATSNQKFKGILEDNSRSSFAGKILVDPVAQQTLSYQQNHNLLLSDTAKAYSMPNLEIFADDVKASHGATVGQLDAEHLFYLKSRGLSLKQAKHLLIDGFISEITQKMIPWE